MASFRSGNVPWNKGKKNPYKIKMGGYRKGSGRGKSGWYKGFYCDSSWELAYVIFNLEHEIEIKRNLERRTYTFGGKEKIYIPDFIVEGKFVEIKGYKTQESEAKRNCNLDVKFLFGKDLKDVFSYVREKYGKDFIKLYEDGKSARAADLVLKTSCKPEDGV